MKYMIARADDHLELENVVNRYIGLGWEPIGSVGHSHWTGNDNQMFETWSQAMVKRS